MEFINKVEVCGMIGTAHTKSIGSTSKVTILTVCVTEDYTNAKGEAIVENTWFQVSVWDSNEEFSKGDFVHIKGRLRMHRFIDPNNNERIIYEIVANEIHKVTIDQK